MSMISKELQDQQTKDVGEAMKKIFGDIPVIDPKTVKEGITSDAKKRMQELERKIMEQSKV